MAGKPASGMRDHSMLLAAFSVLIFVAGVQRSQIYVFFLSAGTALSFPAAPLLLGGLLEIAIGILGLILAGYALVQGHLSKSVSAALILVVTVCQWYIFLIFVFILPGTEASNIVGVPEPFLNRSVWNTFVMSGILASAFYCATLLGGQWMALLAMHQRRKDTDAPFYQLLTLAWSVAILGAGVFILIAGICATTVDPGPHDIAAPPIFIVYSGLPIATGCFAIATGALGLIVAFSSAKTSIVHVFAAAELFNFLWQLAVMALYQPPAQGNFVAATPTAGFILSQLPVIYFAYRRWKLGQESATDEEREEMALSKV